MSDQEVIVSRRRTNRLNLDSEEEARIEAEEQQRQEEIRLKKQEKRKRREEEARQIQQDERKRNQIIRHYEDPQTMLEPDSDSNDKFERAEKKVKRNYPEFKNRDQHQNRRRHLSESEESDSEQQSDGESESEEEQQSRKKKPEKKVKKEKKQRKREDSEQIRAARTRVQKVKVQEKDPKEKLVHDIAVRWWYCLPEWPPVDYDYESELKKLGFRLVQNSRFRMQQNLVNGLFKATTIEGYTGIFKTKQKIIDIRPKETCPSLQFLRSKSLNQLSDLLKLALKQQLNQLNNQSFLGNEDLQLINELSKKLHQLAN